jgi:TetR/AcrR family transcriptional repressor of bet genes
MARPSNTATRRLQIADALLRVMARRGYEGASIAEIAAAAGLAPGLVHYHFAGKRDILAFALDLLATRHAARLDGALAAAGPSPARRLSAFIDAHLARGAAADPVALACWVTLGGEALRDQAVRAAYARAVADTSARLRALLDQGVRARVFSCRPADAAAAILAAIEGCFVLSAAAPGTIPRGSAARSVKRMTASLVGVASLAAAA